MNSNTCTSVQVKFDVFVYTAVFNLVHMYTLHVHVHVHSTFTCHVHVRVYKAAVITRLFVAYVFSLHHDDIILLPRVVFSSQSSPPLKTPPTLPPGSALSSGQDAIALGEEIQELKKQGNALTRERDSARAKLRRAETELRRREKEIEDLLAAGHLPVSQQPGCHANYCSIFKKNPVSVSAGSRRNPIAYRPEARL